MSIQSFIPTIWSARLLMHLNKAHMAKTFFNTDYEGEIKDKGNTVKINKIGAVTISKYTANVDMATPERVNTVAQDLVIDQAESYNWQIDDVDSAQANTTLMDSAMERSAYGLADEMDKYLFKQLATGTPIGNTIGSAGSPILVTASNVYSIIVQLRTILSNSNVPKQNRNLALPPEMVGLILQDDRFTNTGGAFAESTLQSGMVSRGVGFNIYEINNLPETGGVYEIIANHNLSATVAQQFVKTEAYRIEKRFADGVKGLNVYGAKVVLPEAVAKAYVTF